MSYIMESKKNPNPESYLLEMDFVKLTNPLNCFTIEKSVLSKSQWDFSSDGLGAVFPMDTVHFHMLFPDCSHFPFREEIENP